jgi:DNA-binding beta-propeller fold protein YncE
MTMAPVRGLNSGAAQRLTDGVYAKERTMVLEHHTDIALPAHRKPGGFDHAAVHRASARLYVAHTANDALDVIDCATDRYLYSIPNLNGVAGALVSDERNLVFTSNRGENTVGIFSPEAEADLTKVAVGIHPNGLAYDPGRNLLLAANVGDPEHPGSHTVSLVDVDKRALVASVAVSGRTRWTVFDPRQEVFFVNIADPPQIVVIDARHPTQIARVYEVPAAGPHGLDLDLAHGRLFCACDAGRLVCLEAHSGRVLDERDLSGVPDVMFLNAGLGHLYVAIGDPGVIDVFDSRALEPLETVATEQGAHTIAFDSDRHKVYVFLPQTHRAAVYVDTGELRG